MQTPHQQINYLERITCAYLAIFVCLGAYLAIFNQPYFDTIYTVEDGFLEWMTFIALATIAAVFLKRATQVYNNSPKMVFFTTLMVGLLFVFGAGEEISWGQRLFAVESSEFFKANNAQAETNLHNMVINGVKVNKLIFGKGLALIFLIYLGIMTPLYNKNQKFADLLDRLGVPIPQHYQVFGYIIVLLIVEVLIKEFSDTGRRGELTEFGASFIVMLNLLFAKNTYIYTK